MANKKMFRIYSHDLSHIDGENMQYTRYGDRHTEFYNWHYDSS